jgi:hypothetical protein
MSIPRELEGEFDDYINELNQHEDASNEGVQQYSIGNTLKELQEYTNGGPLDWASLPGGPQFIRMPEDSYLKCKDALEQDHILADVSVDYNVCEEFDNAWRENILVES